MTKLTGEPHPVTAPVHLDPFGESPGPQAPKVVVTLQKSLVKTLLPQKSKNDSRIIDFSRKDIILVLSGVFFSLLKLQVSNGHYLIIIAKNHFLLKTHCTFSC